MSSKSKKELTRSNTMNSNSVHQAIEITKAAIPTENGTWVNNPDAVAKFIEVVANKIDDLTHPKTMTANK
jgi:hypothetical protein